MTAPTFTPELVEQARFAFAAGIDVVTSELVPPGVIYVLNDRLRHTVQMHPDDLDALRFAVRLAELKAEVRAMVSAGFRRRFTDLDAFLDLAQET